MGFEQEAYDAECAAIARALGTAARRRKKLGHFTIFTDAQAAIWGITSDDPDQDRSKPSQSGSTSLSSAARNLEYRLRSGTWCPSHCEIEGNEKADEWAKLAADEPDSYGEVWFSYKDRYGSKRMPPHSRVHLKSEFSEAKWTDARRWTKPSSSGPRTASTGPPTSSSRTRLWLEPTRGSPRGFTS